VNKKLNGWQFTDTSNRISLNWTFSLSLWYLLPKR
jgi:hypothetical protein